MSTSILHGVQDYVLSIHINRYYKVVHKIKTPH
jgi:hypothetical protein